jgi:hypothetical protein
VVHATTSHEVLRVGAFAVVAAVLAGLVSLLPPGAEELAIYALLMAGVLGGVLARSGAEVLAFVAGGIAGAILVGVATLGAPGGPSSVGSVLFGVAMVTVLLTIAAAGTRWLVARLGYEVPRARQRRVVLAMLGAGVVLLAMVVVITWGAAHGG